MGNKNLVQARKVKNDEFYTQYSDVQDFLSFYGESGKFKEKIIHLPCDSEKSNFYIYLKENYTLFGIKEIIATSYNPKGGKIVTYKDGEEKILKVKESMSYLEKESQEISKKSDFIISNPPFSSFGVYITFLLEIKKDFIFLSSLNKISQNSFNEVSRNVGSKFFYYGCNLKFLTPDGSFSGVPVMWITNIKNEKKVIRKISHVKPFDKVVSMKSPEGDPIFSCSQVKQLNSEIPGGKYVLAPITIMTYDFQDRFEFLGFTPDKFFGDWYLDGFKKRAFIKNEQGETVALYTRAVLKIKGR